MIHFSPTFGFDNVFPELVKEGEVLFGHQYLGEKGLLEYFELHLGCVTSDVHDAIRIAQFEGIIRTYLEEHPSTFISTSFLNNSWTTAKDMLRWRDELVLAGYNFNEEDRTVERLYVISSLEALSEKLAAGINDRWRYVFQEVSKRELDFLSGLKSYANSRELPPFFQEFFELLKKKGIEIIYTEADLEDPVNTDLGRWQQAISGGTREEFQGDGTITVLKGGSLFLQAQYLSHNMPDDSVVIIQEKGHILDQAIIAAGQPSLGYMSMDDWGDLLQLLHWLPSLIWTTVDPASTMQWLSMPFAPLPRTLRKHLLKAFQKSPGTENDEWHKAIAKYAEQNGLKVEEVQRKIQHWLSRKRYIEKVPISELIILLEDLSHWCRAVQNESYGEACMVLFDEIQNLKELIKATDTVEEITLPQYNEWLSAIQGEVGGAQSKKEVGAHFHVRHPANIVGHCSKVVWWNCCDPGNPIRRKIRWTDQEKKRLHGLALESREEYLRRWYAMQQNAVLRARDSLILCVPSNQEGVHPLYNALMAQGGATEKVMVNLDKSTNMFRAKGIQVRRYYGPKFQKEWKVSANLIPQREKESYSSLSKLFYYPYQHVLRYGLKLSKVNLPDVQVTPLLKGNLAHRVVEILFEKESFWKADNTGREQQIHSTTQAVFDKEGEIFLLPHHEVSKADFLRTICLHVLRLSQMIEEDGWEIATDGLEREVHGHLNGVAIRGFVDLILTRGNESAIVDLKWGGINKRKDQLSNNNALQLNLYERLLRPEYPKIHIAFFILSKGQMLARNKLAFSQAVVTDELLDDTEDRDVLWQKMSSTYDMRIAELQEGYIEVGDGVDFFQLKSKVAKSPETVEIPEGNREVKAVDDYNDYTFIRGQK